uniref:Sodium-coupled monocarboxylate transporter 1 n=1 Tax=Anopheles farauti TaxID=69004 RepID=A0A182Q1N6_9DIPT
MAAEEVCLTSSLFGGWDFGTFWLPTSHDRPLSGGHFRCPLAWRTSEVPENSFKYTTVRAISHDKRAAPRGPYFILITVDGRIPNGSVVEDKPAPTHQTRYVHHGVTQSPPPVSPGWSVKLAPAMSSDWSLTGGSGEDYSVEDGAPEEENASGQTIDSISRSLQRFDWPDYVVFVLMLLICVLIGIFFGYRDHQKHKRRGKRPRRDSEALDYLVGGRKMQIFPVSVSLVASWISGISLLGTSTEIYVYGTQYCYIVFAVILMGFVMHHVFLPVFHELQITSAYEGGLKAVVWTDVIQSGVTLLALLAVLIKGTIDVGGPWQVLERNIAGDRLEAPNLDLDPTLRHSIWIILIGAPVWFCYGVSCSQDMIQRFLALPTLQDARKALKGFVIGWIVVNLTFFAIGMLVYATYYRCDPLTTQLARAKDQLLPLFVMETFAAYPGMTGVFVAGIFSAALSSLSSALNALSAVTLEDFFKPFCKKPLTESQVNYIMRGSVLVYGALSVLLSLLVEHLGTVMQLTMTLSSASGAPLFGLFVMGIFMPWVNGTGALYGGVTGLLVMLHMCYKAQYSIASGSRTFDTKPVSVDDCPYEHGYNMTMGRLDADTELEQVEKSIYHMSYMYFTLFGTSVTCLSGTVISLLTKLSGTARQQPIDPKLLAPCIRGMQPTGVPLEFLAVPTDSKRAEMSEATGKRPLDSPTSTMSSEWLSNGDAGADEPLRNTERTAGKTIVSLQRFDWPDYAVFVLMLLVCIAIGLYYGYGNRLKRHRDSVCRKQSEDYLVGGRTMGTFPVAVSLVASWVSGVPMLGTATEIYVYGTQFCYIVCAMLLAGCLMHHLFLPVFHGLQITSTYEYLQRRFDARMRLFGSILFVLACVLWMPIVIYVPALAFNQVTGLSIHTVTPIVCLICMFYTSIGGLRAVVWTDVIQSGVTLLALLAVLIKGTSNVGGPGEVLRRNIAGERLETPVFDPNPTLRHSFWIMLLGAPVWVCEGIACSQDMVQRFLALPTLRDARKALKAFVLGWCGINGIFFALGMLVYATYYRCDPLTTQLVSAKDQLLPLFVMETFAAYPGMTGVFVAGIFSAALSSLSSALNALSAVTLEDFFKPYCRKPLTEQQTLYIMRGSVLVYGALSVLLSLLVEHLGTVMQLAMTLSSASAAPLLGMFVMGILMPWVNGTGALYGGSTGLLVMFYMCYNAEYSIAFGSRTFDMKPVSVEECPYEFAFSNTTAAPGKGPDEEHLSIYHISYMYFTLFGTTVTCLAGTIVSLLSRLRRSGQQPQPIDQKLLAPCIRRKESSGLEME